MSFSSVEAHAKEYFWSLSPLAKRVASDVAAARDAYEDLWITLSLSDQKQVVDDAIIRPDAALKYSFCPRGRAPVEYFPRLRLQTGGRIVSEDDGKVSWRDEHSAPFSFMTRSQLNLALTGADQQGRGSPRKQAEGFIDPPSVVLGGSSCKQKSPTGPGFLSRLKNNSAVLKIQSLSRAPADREALLSPESKPVIAAVTAVPVNKPGVTKPLAPKPVESKPAAPKFVETKPAMPNPVALKPVDSKPVTPKPVTPKPVAPKPGDSKPVAPKPGDSKPVAPKPGDSKPVTPKLVAPPKSVALKPVDSKPVTLKPVAPKPVAPKAAATVPVVAVEKAAKESPRKQARVSKPRTPPPPPPGRDPERMQLLPSSPDLATPDSPDLATPDSPDLATRQKDIDSSHLAALQANLSLESLQEFHSALNSPTGSDHVPKTGFDFLDNW